MPAARHSVHRTALPRPTSPRAGARTARLLAAAAALALAQAPSPARAAEPYADLPRGNDVSSHQGTVDWKKAYEAGARFSYVKATESTTYKNPYFRGQFDGSREAGMLRGAYHFALPDRSSGAAQAAYFLKNGGGWAADGRTLPPALDIEANPYGAECYGLDEAGLADWVRDFSDEVRRSAGVLPVIYTSTRWWNTCTGGNRGFGDHALWVPDYAASPGALPAGWTTWTFWQYADHGPMAGDQNRFHGDADALARFAAG
ncbi:lysozyme [Streptomyces sp. NPDC050560]|uniref:lysozyme n=1 Tax=Streptomyces sp. NPDC050560 TaxID=3365630 RepID=UPI00379FBA92